FVDAETQAIRAAAAIEVPGQTLLEFHAANATVEQVVALASADLDLVEGVEDDILHGGYEGVVAGSAVVVETNAVRKMLHMSVAGRGELADERTEHVVAGAAIDFEFRHGSP